MAKAGQPLIQPLVQPLSAPLQADALLGGAGATLRGDMWIDFTTMSNGAPGNAQSGEKLYLDYAGVGNATVQNGALVVTTESATYNTLKGREEIKSALSDVSFSDANDVMALIVTPGEGQAAVGTTCIHLAFSPGAWVLSYFSGLIKTDEQSGSFPNATYGSKARMGFELVPGSGFYITVPDSRFGTRSSFISAPNTASRGNHCIMFEHYRNGGGVPGGKFFGVAAKLFANPTAAGRSNLLVAPNNLANAAWSKFLTGPTSGQPDADGGTLAEKMMEGSANQLQFFYQGVSKAAAPIRYTHRAKVKLIGRDWASLITKNAGFTDLSPRDYSLTTRVLGADRAGLASDRYSMLYPLGNGFFQIQEDFTSDSTNMIYPAFGVTDADGGNVAGYAGDITKGMLIYDEWLIARPT